jgi:hypothetical protein
MSKGRPRGNLISTILLGLTWASILGIWIQETLR